MQQEEIAWTTQLENKENADKIFAMRLVIFIICSCTFSLALFAKHEGSNSHGSKPKACMEYKELNYCVGDKVYYLHNPLYTLWPGVRERSNFSYRIKGIYPNGDLNLLRINRTSSVNYEKRVSPNKVAVTSGCSTFQSKGHISGEGSSKKCVGDKVDHHVWFNRIRKLRGSPEFNIKGVYPNGGSPFVAC